ncbi:MAG TPA: DNA polymerase/3'-5' exonuclease PolX, partial [Chloroflexi bacterium]|nr:DNA polymerase/3'-5' exonuclease PolX [Chloroflexota bacterium]
MPVYNSDVARIFNQIADLLEIGGGNEYRVRAYRDAARTIATLSSSVADMVAEDEDLTELEGIGDSMAGKITEIVKTGGLKQLEEIEQRTPPALADMLNISGLGPKRVRAIYENLGVTSLEGLKAAAEQGRIRDLEGFGETIEQKIVADLAQAEAEETRTRLDVAEELTEPLVGYLREIEGIQRVIVAGSYRRRKETVGDLDILATGRDSGHIIDRFVAYEDVAEVVSQGETRSTVMLRTGLQVDLRVVADESYGAALLYFTGSKAHNITLRNMALDQDLKINEYGVFQDEARVAGETEAEIYGLFDLPYIVPELREDRGEIEAAREGNLPQLVALEDIQGDLQMHTDASDGHNTLEEMARAAKRRGYAYIAITDHSTHVAVTQGLDAEALARRVDEIDRLNDELDGIRILKGIEVDILKDGSLDLPDEALEKLDLVIGSVHVNFDLSREKQTERIIRAMDNPHFNILAHPTGRKIGERDPYEVDVERLMEAALERG